jgi:hypothetical protein
MRCIIVSRLCDTESDFVFIVDTNCLSSYATVFGIDIKSSYDVLEVVKISSCRRSDGGGKGRVANLMMDGKL